VGSLQSGLYYGYLGLVDGILELLLKELGEEAKVVARRLGHAHRNRIEIHLRRGRILDARRPAHHLGAQCCNQIWSRAIAGESKNAAAAAADRPASKPWPWQQIQNSLTSRGKLLQLLTEIEEHFQRRRGGPLLVSTVDWGLIENLEGRRHSAGSCAARIDEAFDKYERRPLKNSKDNGLAWCAQAVLTAAEDMKEAAVGSSEEKKQSETGTRVGNIRHRGFSAPKCKASAGREVAGGSRVQVRVLAEETCGDVDKMAASLGTQDALRLGGF